MKKKYIYIGDKFYWKSGSAMSSVYEETSRGFERSDWGKIQLWLKEGNEVSVRKATEEELEKFEKTLISYKKELNK